MTDFIFEKLEDIETAFTDDEAARKYFFEVRWGRFASCPYCLNEKCYFLKGGVKYKCAKCKTIFSVTVRTVFQDTNLKLHKLFKIFFLYIKSKGKILSTNLSQDGDISLKTEFYIRDKLDFVWGKTTIGANHTETFKNFILGCVYSYNEYEIIKSLPYFKNPNHIADHEIYDISKPDQYNKLLRYTKYFMYVWCRKKKGFIFLDFAAPEEIMSEVFLYIQEQRIVDYNATIIIKAIWLLTNRMWIRFLNEHPKYHNYMKSKRKWRKKEIVAKLLDTYIVDALKKSKKYSHISRFELKNNKELIKAERERLIKKRGSKNNSDYYSHFS